MSAWLRHVTTVVLLTLASVCAGVSTPAWEAKTAHRGFVAAAAVAASEIASVTPSRVKEKSVLSGKGTVSSPVYTFDDVNRLKTVKPVGSSVPIATYGYDGVGNRESVTHDNGVTTTYAYNCRNRLTGIQHKLGATLLLGVAYTLDASGLRTAITETGQIERTVSYAYDGVKRLTSETVTQLGNDRRTSWTYDRTGNRLTQTKSLGPVGSPTGTANTAYVYDANDRLETEAVTLSGSVPGAVAGTTTYTYDNAGNTTRKVGPAETIDYVYDDANRLAEIQTLAGEVTRYAYGHDGIRLSQTTNATAPTAKTTHYLIDPNQPYAQVIEEAEQVGSGALSVKALYAVGDDRVRRYTPAVAANGSNPGVPAGLRYYHADGLGSTRLLTDEAGAVTDKTTFEAFGEIDAAASQQTSGNDFLYAGEQLDPNSGFVYLRARYMSPANGRFTQVDAFDGLGLDPLSLHKYLYAHSGPVNYTDPSGHYTMGQVVTVVNVAGNAHTVATIAVNILAGNYISAAGMVAEEVVYSKLGAVGRPVAHLSKRAIALFNRIFSRTIKLKLGRPPSGVDLAHNLEQVGVARPSNTQAHHIVAGTSSGAREAQAALRRHDIDINSPTNGVFLPDCNSVAGMGAIHCGSHAREYMEMVNERILDAEAAGGKIGVLNALSEIKVELLAGMINLNKHGVR